MRSNAKIKDIGSKYQSEINSLIFLVSTANTHFSSIVKKHMLFKIY